MVGLEWTSLTYDVDSIIAKLAPTILATLLCGFVVPRIICWFQIWNALRALPGPSKDSLPFWFILTLARSYVRDKIQLKDSTAWVFDQIRVHCERYVGKTFKVYIGMTPLVVVHTPDATEALLSSTTNLRKPFLYDFLAGWLGKQSMVLATGSIWRFKRKLMTPAFHFRILENYMAIFNQNADLLVRRLCSFVDKAPSEPIRLFENTQKCALDIIGEVTMGAKLHVQEGKNLNFMSSFNSASLLVGLRALRPWLWLQFIYDRTPEGKLFKKNMKEIESFTHLVMLERKEKLEKIEAMRESDFQDDEIKMSRTDTTLMNLLLKAHLQDNKYTEEDVKKDIDTVFGAEGLRLYPSFPYIGRVLDHDLEIDGYKIPKGVSCFVNIYSLHRNPEHFKNPEEFVPDRFMGHETTRRHPFSYIPFSGGPKNCLGQRFATVESKLLLAKVLSKFTIESTRPLEQIKVTFEVIIRARGGHQVWLRRRTQMDSFQQLN
ncbi:cytochrome P450 4V2 [Ixodes scapularis]